MYIYIEERFHFLIAANQEPFEIVCGEVTDWVPKNSGVGSAVLNKAFLHFLSFFKFLLAFGSALHFENSLHSKNLAKNEENLCWTSPKPEIRITGTRDPSLFSADEIFK